MISDNVATSFTSADPSCCWIARATGPLRLTRSLLTLHQSKREPRSSTALRSPFLTVDSPRLLLKTYMGSGEQITRHLRRASHREKPQRDFGFSRGETSG